ncbi:MaoC/PaaZ C-terminal domain-containing protein [Streptomyces sulphureus]|uniref:MaoC/PaaZ C-terminal domain-containing protein n=1 Tax=Streptomyces sulphureus TaxID=47758 RepID=UPI00037B0911|nr:MaoC/PaaZ C-terminal domain-containing protein [Streptomyces sulphureus]
MTTGRAALPPAPGPAVHGPVTRTDFVRYQGASGDMNPVHHDEEYARAAGFPSPFSVGMFRAGLLASWATDWLGAHNVRRFRAYLGELDAAYGAVLATGGDAATRLRALVLASLHVSHARPHATEVYQLNRGYFASHDRFASVRGAAARIFRTWQETIADGVAERAFRRDVGARVFHRFLRDAVFLSVRWFRPSEGYGVEELATDTAEIFLEGFGADE